LNEGKLVAPDDTLDYGNGGMAETMMTQRGGRLDGTKRLSI
jgi:hypothetical protein